MTESHVGDPKSGVFRLMAVHAHPDDESSKGAATMARYVAEGVAAETGAELVWITPDPDTGVRVEDVAAVVGPAVQAVVEQRSRKETADEPLALGGVQAGLGG